MILTCDPNGAMLGANFAVCVIGLFSIIISISVVGIIIWIGYNALKQKPTRSYAKTQGDGE